MVIVEAQLSTPTGAILSLSNPTVTATTFTYTTQLNSFGASDSGIYSCTATIRPQPAAATYITGVGMLSNTTRITVGVVVDITFEFTSSDDSSDITFSLSCNSQFGEPGNRAIWTRDGILLDNTGSLDLVNASTFSYTNVLMVRGRMPGTYTCQVRGSDDQLLNSATFTVQDTEPPVNVRATQPISSSPVEVSWTLPSSNGAIQITGYRVFYGTSQGRSVLVPSYINSMVLNFVDSSLRIETVSVRSESSQLPSESISATVTAVDTTEQVPSQSEETVSCTCTNEVGLAVGMVILIEGVIAIVTATTVVLYWFIMRRRKSGKGDFAVSENMAYTQVNMGAINPVALATEGEEEQYEDPDKLARHGRRGLRERYAPAVQDSTPSPYELPLSSAETHVGSSSMPAAGPAYATADEVGRSWKDTKIAADNMTAEASQYY